MFLDTGSLISFQTYSPEGVVWSDITPAKAVQYIQVDESLPVIPVALSKRVSMLLASPEVLGSISSVQSFGFLSYFNNPTLSDFVIQISPSDHNLVPGVIAESTIPMTAFHVHKLILHQSSEYFAKMFSSEMMEVRLNNVVLNDIGNIPLFDLFLQLIYGHTNQNMGELLIKFKDRLLDSFSVINNMSNYDNAPVVNIDFYQSLLQLMCFADQFRCLTVLNYLQYFLIQEIFTNPYIVSDEVFVVQLKDVAERLSLTVFIELYPKLERMSAFVYS
jgi:hypothetical protein